MSDALLPEGLETERLKFRCLDETDFPSVLKFVHDPLATRYFIGMGEPDAYARSWMNRVQERKEKKEGGLMALIHKETGEFIGMSGLLSQTVDEKPYLEIGYHLQPEHWHHGYATEAARSLKEYAFSSGITPHLISIIHIDNLPSQAVARRNGMVIEKETTWKEMPVLILGTRKK
jgi:[ribosomal protein S5]-alanine N-acetyltransferase